MNLTRKAKLRIPSNCPTCSYPAERARPFRQGVEIRGHQLAIKQTVDVADNIKHEQVMSWERARQQAVNELFLQLRNEAGHA